MNAQERVLAAHPGSFWLYRSGLVQNRFEIWCGDKKIGAGPDEDSAWENAAGRLSK